MQDIGGFAWAGTGRQAARPPVVQTIASKYQRDWPINLQCGTDLI